MNDTSNPSNSELLIDLKLQRMLFEKLVNNFSAISHVDSIIQRGSLAKNLDDRASDVDILLVIQDQFFEKFVNELDKYIHLFTNCLTKTGWIDSIVPNFGGIGFVYLVKYKHQLIQLDVYITPSSHSKKIFEFSEKIIKYIKPGFVFPDNFGELNNKSFSKFLQEYSENADLEFQIIFECILMIEMYIKHIYRGKITLACKYRYGSIESLAIFLRLLFTPERLDYRMYDWEKDFANISSPIIKLFERSIQNIHVFDENEALTLLRILKIALLEGRLKKRYIEFKPLIIELDSYIKNLMNPFYLAKNE